jgi:succinate dehydrogenase / fumarate reductase cytochrome b subunit
VNRLLALWDTTVGKKVAMAVTGLAMVLFLISHMISNVLIYKNPQHLDDYGVFLRSFGPLLWVARIGMLAAVGIHIAAAWQLTRLAAKARPASYSKHEHQVATYASRTMRWGGVLLLVFIVFHLLHFTFGVLPPGFDFREGEVGRNVLVGMQTTWVAIFYALSMIALGAHFWHGIWSTFQTLGLNHPAWNLSRKVIAIGLAVLVAGGFLSIPLGAMLGFLHP